MRGVEWREVPFWNVSNDLERLFHALISNLCAFFDFGVICVPVEPEDVERVFGCDGDEGTGS